MEEFSKEELKNEKWKDIFGYDGMYQVSDLGRVRSKKYGDWRVMKAYDTGGGYLQVQLNNGGKRNATLVHRLVAQAFIENYNIFNDQVNHKDENKQNNRVSNLEWCTAQYNNTYNDIHHRRKSCKPVRDKIKELYRPELSIDENLKVFKEQGIKCSKKTIVNLRKDLNLKQPQPVRDKIKDLYNPDISARQNLEIFKTNGIECCRRTVWLLRKDLGLTKKHTKAN